MSNQQDELAPEKTEGFKVGEKKTLEEYKTLGTFVRFLVMPENSLTSGWFIPMLGYTFYMSSLHRRSYSVLCFVRLFAELLRRFKKLGVQAKDRRCLQTRTMNPFGVGRSP